MTTTPPPRNRVALRLLSTAFLATAVLTFGGTASARGKAKPKAEAAASNETPAAPAAEAPAAAAPAAAAPAAAAPAAAAPAAAAPAAAAPAAETPAPTADEPSAPAAAAKAQRKIGGNATQLGISPQDTLAGGASGPPAVTEAAPVEDWGFKFHGFFRGPMRLSMDSERGKGIQFHAPPVTPDSNYTTWSYTNNNPGPWAELLFQYGNNRATMTAAIASYNITSGGWRELQDQLGIDRAFLTLNFPDALGDLGKLTWNVGVFSNRYGAMGKYDAGAYETHMIGRTRVAGETLTAEFDLGDDIKVVAEHGIGAKMDSQQWMPAPYTSWQPYPGYAQVGTTLLHHAHLGAVFMNMLTLTGHYMYSWTKDGMRTDWNGEGQVIPDQTTGKETLTTPDGKMPWKGSANYNGRDGSMRVLGLDLRLDGGWMGDGYIGFSSIKSFNAGVLSDAIEVIHSQGGWQFTNNYLGRHGDGTVNSIGFQYTFSLAAFLLRPQTWWGQGRDLTVQVFGMYNTITGLSSDSTDIKGTDGFGTRKLKLGGQTLYTPLPYLSFGARFDYLKPNMDNSTHNFWVVSPRLIFRTEFVTHEQIIIQYQYYSYGSWYTTRGFGTSFVNPATLPSPYGGTGPLFYPTQPDKHTITIAASMWW